MKKLIAICLLLVVARAGAQDVYVINEFNEIKIVDVSDFSVTNLFAIDIITFGSITDLAFAPDGRLFGVTSLRTLIEIDLINESASVIYNLPNDAAYTSLVCNSDFELLTAKFLNLELYAYNINSGDFDFVDSGISSPGDFTFYKGNLIYPNIFNDFIKAYDGNELFDVGCSVPLIFTFVNVFEDCETNTVYGIDEDSKVYLYDLEADTRELVADLLSETNRLFGGATMTEYMASDCPLEPLNEVVCDLSIGDLQFANINLLVNPVKDLIMLEGEVPSDTKFEIFEVSGKLVRSGSLPDEGIEVGALRPGLYFLSLYDTIGNLIFRSKIVKK